MSIFPLTSHVWDVTSPEGSVTLVMRPKASFLVVVVALMPPEAHAGTVRLTKAALTHQVSAASFVSL